MITPSSHANQGLFVVEACANTSVEPIGPVEPRFTPSCWGSRGDFRCTLSGLTNAARKQKEPRDHDFMHHASLIRQEKHTALSRGLLTWWEGSVSAFGFALYSYTERIPPMLHGPPPPRPPSSAPRTRSPICIALHYALRTAYSHVCPVSHDTHLVSSNQRRAAWRRRLAGLVRPPLRLQIADCSHPTPGRSFSAFLLLSSSVDVARRDSLHASVA